MEQQPKLNSLGAPMLHTNLSAGPTEEQIIAAISQSGYLLEQEVGSILESSGFHVETNAAFRDPEEDKSREIDVKAISRLYFDEPQKIAVYVEILCECKNNTNPFVFLQRKKNSQDNLKIPTEYVFPVTYIREKLEQNSYREIPIFQYLRLEQKHYSYSSDLKAVQFAKIVRSNKSWEAMHDGIYDAIFYPMAKALISRQAEIKKFQSWNYVWLFFPIVVLAGPIYAIDTTGNPLKASEASFVSFSRELKSKHVDGRFRIDFVTKARLKSFVDDQILSFANVVIDEIKAKPKLFRAERDT